MTQQFKFGDRVRDEQGNEFIVIREEGAYCEVINARGKKNDFKRCQLTPAHTDDTARLDWLAKNDCALTENLGDEDGDRQDTPFAVIHVQEEHFEVLAAANNIRQAIDTAMQAQAAEAEAT